MTIHELKCWPEFYQAMESGAKTFDIRREDDRTFAVGDLLLMRWWDPQEKRYSMFPALKPLLFEVLYCLRSAPPWVAEGYVAMGLRRVQLECSAPEIATEGS